VTVRVSVVSITDCTVFWSATPAAPTIPSTVEVDPAGFARTTDTFVIVMATPVPDSRTLRAPDG
jgi:hypothetical protein